MASELERTNSHRFCEQAKAEEGDTDAADKRRRYQKRSGEELDDVTTDPYEWNNLADNPEYTQVKAELRTELLRWQFSCSFSWLYVFHPASTKVEAYES